MTAVTPSVRTAVTPSVRTAVTPSVRTAVIPNVRTAASQGAMTAVSQGAMTVAMTAAMTNAAQLVNHAAVKTLVTMTAAVPLRSNVPLDVVTAMIFAKSRRVSQTMGAARIMMTAVMIVTAIVANSWIQVAGLTLAAVATSSLLAACAPQGVSMYPL
nr:uncharacterized protein LOC106687103 isoform X3 [Halyomorpha halys]